MRRGSSTNIDIDAPDIEEAITKNIYVNFKQGGFYLKKEATMIDGKAHIELTPEETFKMAPGRIFMQVETHTKDDRVIQSNVMMSTVEGSLNAGNNGHHRQP